MAAAPAGAASRELAPCGFLWDTPYAPVDRFSDAWKSGTRVAAI